MYYMKRTFLETLVIDTREFERKCKTKLPYLSNGYVMSKEALGISTRVKFPPSKPRLLVTGFRGRQYLRLRLNMCILNISALFTTEVLKRRTQYG